MIVARSVRDTSWLDALVLPPSYRHAVSDRWVSLTRDDGVTARLAQGWKLHISARPESLHRTVLTAAPILFEMGCDFKVVANPSILGRFNHGLDGAGAVGKAITVYPSPHTVVDVAHRLARALRGVQAPHVPSDRQVASDAPIYYRYGPFASRLLSDDSGYLQVAVEGPGGALEVATAGDSYRQPTWVKDPFKELGAAGAHLPTFDGRPVIGDHYAITSAIAKNFSGTVYRAVDRRSGARVVIKEAAGFVNETESGDTRTYLRHELGVLRALEGIERVPKALDHFRYGDDEYLVTSDLGEADLYRDLLDHGVFTPTDSGPRSVGALARSLLDILDSVHSRGVVFRDLAPQNVISLGRADWGIVDFELSRFNGTQRYGWTPGYAAPGQREDREAVRSDDYHSLGAVLFFSVMGMDPISIDDAVEVNAARTVECLRQALGGGAPLTSIVDELLLGDAHERDRAVSRLRGSWSEGSRPVSSPRSSLESPFVSLDGLHTSMLEYAVEQAEGNRAALVGGGVPPPLVAQVGSVALAAELARHPTALRHARSLAEAIVSFLPRVELPVGLLYGRTGVSVGIADVACAAGDPSLRHAAKALLPSADELRDEQRLDVAHGIAGIGMGYLHVRSHLADECAVRIADPASRLLDEQLRELPSSQPAHGISIADGFAHGRIGIAYFLLAHAAQTGSARSRDAAHEQLDAVLRVVPRLVERAHSPRARPMCASWCQGLSGIGSTFVRAASFFSDDRYLEAALRAAEACAVLAPRIPLVTQCCGLAGVGELFLDLSNLTGERSHSDRAATILSAMLVRSGGSTSSPRIFGSVARSPGWGNGSAGILGFLRRLTDPSTPRQWYLDARGPYAIELRPRPAR